MEAVKMIQGSDDKVRYMINALRYLLKDELNVDTLKLIRKEYLDQLPVSLFGNIIDKL